MIPRWNRTLRRAIFKDGSGTRCCASGKSGTSACSLLIIGLQSCCEMAAGLLIFQTKQTSLWLAQKMVAEGLPVALLTGDLTVEQRADVIRRFRDGKDKVLITTNVSSRGTGIWVCR